MNYCRVNVVLRLDQLHLLLLIYIKIKLLILKQHLLPQLLDRLDMLLTPLMCLKLLLTLKQLITHNTLKMLNLGFGAAEKLAFMLVLTRLRFVGLRPLRNDMILHLGLVRRARTCCLRSRRLAEHALSLGLRLDIGFISRITLLNERNE